MFPSPRGVELHKPRTIKGVIMEACSQTFPSPRGVELHKPDKEVIRFHV